MPKINRPRFGSLQYWPRKRTERALPRVNWDPIKNNSDYRGFLAFISYKVGMASAVVRDNTKDSMTKGKKITLPVSILEVPKMKIFSVRFYNNGIIKKEVVVSNDKILKKRIKIQKEIKNNELSGEADEIRVIMYSVLDKMFKKTPDFAEVAIKEEKPIEFIKNFVGKEISLNEVLKWNLVDLRGATRGKGLVGPVKRFGITLKSHKSEKGVRRPGSLGPWHPARVTFRTPMAGQMGMFSRITYNSRIIGSGSVLDKEKDINKKSGFKDYGMINNDYLIVSGSVQGPAKRAILITPSIRPNKKQNKKSYDLLELR